MAIRIKPIGDIGSKFIRVTPARVDDYVAGVQDPGVAWAPAAAAAAGTYAEGVQQAIADNRFQKGVAAAGDESWRERVTTLGKDRFGPGVRASQQRYQEGFSAYRDAIERTTLPPRGIRGSAANQERSAVMQRVLHELRLRR
jgi:hypothetical protein